MPISKSIPVRSERIWRCDCGSMHYLSVVRWRDPDDDHCCYFTMEDASYYKGATLWQRIKAAWSVFRGNHYSWSEIVVTPTVGREIAQELLEASDDNEKWEQENARRAFYNEYD